MYKVTLLRFASKRKRPGPAVGAAAAAVPAGGGEAQAGGAAGAAGAAAAADAPDPFDLCDIATTIHYSALIRVTWSDNWTIFRE